MLCLLPAWNFTFKFLQSRRMFPKHEQLTWQVISYSSARQTLWWLERTSLVLQSLFLGLQICFGDIEENLKVGISSTEVGTRFQQRMIVQVFRLQSHHFEKSKIFSLFKKTFTVFVCDNFFWSLLFLFLDWLFSEIIFRTAARSVKFHISFRFRVCVFLQFFFMEILQVHSTGNVELVVRFSIIYKPGKKRKFYLKKLTFKN